MQDHCKERQVNYTQTTLFFEKKDGIFGAPGEKFYSANRRIETAQKNTAEMQDKFSY